MLKIYSAGCARLKELAPGIPPSKAWSTGSIVSHMRRSAQIRPAAKAMETVPMSIKGATAGAFCGPRCEAALVGVAVPMGLVDIRGTYPGCFTALDLTRFLIAESIQFEDTTDEYTELLAAPRLLGRLFDPDLVRYWGPSIVVLKSSHDAELSAAVEWSPDRTGGTVAPLHFPEPGGLPRFWSDVALAKVRGGSFEIARVLRPSPVGVQPDLRPYRMPDGIEIDLVTDDLGVAWRDYRERSGSGVAKLGGNADTFGLPARHDQKHLDRAVDLTGYGPRGEALTLSTRNPEYPAPDTSLLVAGAVTSLCRMVVGLAATMLEREGFTVAHFATDSMAVPASKDCGLWPCPGGKHRMPDGRSAIKLATPDQLRTILHRFDPLLGHRGGPAWKEEVESLTKPTIGVVLGVNKVVLGRQDDKGDWQVVRSTDADLGGHLIDPTGTGRRTEDGRWQWAADLERHLLTAAVETDPADPIVIPADLPEFAHRLALRAERASTWKELQNLRRQTGDPTVMPFARYVRTETGGQGAGPVALGHHPDPLSWPDLDFRVRGESVALQVLDPDGERIHAAGDRKARRRIVVHAVADHLARWLREVDPSMEGPRRGLRTPVPVHTHPALFHVTGRAGELMEDGSESPALEFGAAEGWQELRRAALRIGAPEIARLGDMSRRTVSNVLSGGSKPTEATLATIAAALARASRRRCPGCDQEITGRSDRRWCSDRCRKATRRAAAKERTEVSQVDRPPTGIPKPADRTWIEQDPQWVERGAWNEAS
jgi:hypothetical protein